MKVSVDPVRCDSYGACQMVAPEVFLTDPDGGPVTILIPGDIPEELEGKVIRAVERCPKIALSLDPDPFA